jgi:hypothetical protein
MSDWLLQERGLSNPRSAGVSPACGIAGETPALRRSSEPLGRWRVRNDLGAKLFLIVLAAILLAPGSGQFARGEDDWDAEGPVPNARAVAREGLQFNAEVNVNSWVCGTVNLTQAQQKTETLLKLRVSSLERAGGLSKADAEKLRLAGQNDVASFFRRLDALKQECRGLNVNDRKFQEMWQKIEPLRTQFNGGLFNDTSLFSKVLHGMMRRDPSAPYRKEEEQRRRFCYRATIEVAVTVFENGVPLTDAQRQKFLKVLCDELPPPKSVGRQAEYVVFCQASKLDEAKLKPIFDAAQWRALSNLLRMAKGMEQGLKSNGYIP